MSFFVRFKGLISAVASISPGERRRYGGRGEKNREIEERKETKDRWGDERRRKNRKEETSATKGRGIKLREGPRYTQTLLLSKFTDRFLNSACYCCQQPALTTLTSKVTFLSYSHSEEYFLRKLLSLYSPLHLSVSSTCMRHGGPSGAHTHRKRRETMNTHTHTCEREREREW